MESLLRQYGYALLFLGVAVEGEAVLLAAGALAARGVLWLPGVMAVAVAGNACADQFYFHVARRRGRAWLERRFDDQPRYVRLVDAMRLRGGLWLALSRYAYGLRIVIPAACGALGMSRATFTLLDLLAGALWAPPLAWLGSTAGSAWVEGLQRGERSVALFGALLLIAGLGVRYAARAIRWRELRWADLHGVAPFLVGLTGAANVAAALWPTPPVLVGALAGWLPIGLAARGRAALFLAGLALLQLTRHLARRQRMAWGLALIALGLTLASHAIHGAPGHHLLLPGLLSIYLIAFHARFTARSDATALRRATWTAPALLAAVWAVGALGLDGLRARYSWSAGDTPALEAARDGLLAVDPGVAPLDARAAGFLGVLPAAGWATRCYLLGLLLRPAAPRRRRDPGQPLRRLLAWHGRSSLSAFATLDDKHHFEVLDGHGAVTYSVRRGVAFAAGDPLCAPDDTEAALRAWSEHCRRQGWTPCAYEASPSVLPACARLGWRWLKVAEEALIDLPTFSLAGGARATLRGAVHRAERAGLQVRPYLSGVSREAWLDRQLAEVSRLWLAEQRLAELGFSLSRFSCEALDDARLFVCLADERVVAFTTWRSYAGGRAAVLDLMRRRLDAPSGAMDLLVTRSLDMLRNEGLEQASLANAPLANVGEPRGWERGVALAFEHLGAIYGYKSLFQFKKKFAPRWEGRYLAYPGGVALPNVVWALAELHGAGGLRRLVFGGRAAAQGEPPSSSVNPKRSAMR